MLRHASLSAAAVVLLLGFTGLAHAHAHLVSAAPPVGGTVTTAPSELDLNFSEELNLKFTGLKVTGPDGAEVKVDSEMLMNGDKTFMAMLKGQLATGTYNVNWHALSRDGHKTKGSYSFTVKP